MIEPVDFYVKSNFLLIFLFSLEDEDSEWGGQIFPIIGKERAGPKAWKSHLDHIDANCVMQTCFSYWKKL